MVASVLWMISGTVHAYDLDAHMGGFEFGSSLADAEAHAAANGWNLRQVSPEIPLWWTVDGSNISLGVCGDMVGSVARNFAGGLHEFTSIIWDMTWDWGKPVDTKIITLNAGAAKISNIDAHFKREDGTSAFVQFSKTDDRETQIYVSYGSNLSCLDCAQDNQTR